jgi:hypothetical protein
MTEIYARKIKGITGNGTTTVKIYPDPNSRLHKVNLNIYYAAGTNTLAGMGIAISEIRVLVGTAVRRRLRPPNASLGAGTVLRDYMLLNGTTYDWQGLPNTATTAYVAGGVSLTIPFNEDWFLASVGDSLAWNPAILGAAISIEIDCANAITVDATQFVSSDLNAPSSGIITWEMIAPVVGGQSTFIQKEITPRGRLVQATIYPDTTNSNAITPASLMVGSNESFAWENICKNELLSILADAGMTPTASGRTANLYDMVFVRGDALSHAIDLAAWQTIKMQLQAAAAMAGTCSILLARLEAK